MDNETTIYNYFNFISDKVYHGYSYPNTSEKIDIDYRNHIELYKQKYEIYLNLSNDCQKYIDKPGYSKTFYHKMKALKNEIDISKDIYFEQIHQ